MTRGHFLHINPMNIHAKFQRHRWTFSRRKLTTKSQCPLSQTKGPQAAHRSDGPCPVTWRRQLGHAPKWWTQQTKTGKMTLFKWPYLNQFLTYKHFPYSKLINSLSSFKFSTGASRMKPVTFVSAPNVWPTFAIAGDQNCASKIQVLDFKKSYLL